MKKELYDEYKVAMSIIQGEGIATDTLHPVNNTAVTYGDSTTNDKGEKIARDLILTDPVDHCSE